MIRLISMEKEKNKANPKRRWIKRSGLTIFVLSMICSCGSFFYYVYPGHNLSYFGRFKTEAEVVGYLHDNFDLYITTSDEILTFMSKYPHEGDGCWDSTPSRGDFANFVVDEETTNIINCIVPARLSFPGDTAYLLRFYINSDGQLVYISARRRYYGI